MPDDTAPAWRAVLAALWLDKDATAGDVIQRVNELTAQAREASRREALEEAAARCAAIGDRLHGTEAEDAARECFAAIRALAGTP